jgi:hypothetical protein
MEFTLRNGQRWVLSSSPVPPDDIQSFGAWVLSAAGEVPQEWIEAAAQMAIAGRCPVIAAFGADARSTEDRIDCLLEDAGAFEVLTAANLPHELEDVIAMLSDSLAGQGPVFVVADSLHLIEDGLRKWGLAAT